MVGTLTLCPPHEVRSNFPIQFSNSRADMISRPAARWTRIVQETFALGNVGCERQTHRGGRMVNAPFRERARATRGDVNAGRLLPRSKAMPRDNPQTGW